ncbi:MAG: lysophospholipid acyltransferase family protein [Pseudomonadota bacterium]
MLLPAGHEARTGIGGHVIPMLARGIIRAITWSVRIRCEGINVLDDLESEGRTAILAFFHGRQFLLTGFLAGRKLGVMASLSRDGELQSRVMAGFGFEVVRGSASRSGARGLIGLKNLMGRGYHATFAVDGPRGPIHEVKPGAVYLAKKTGAPVLALGASANPAHIFSRAWDHYLLPRPFARGAVVFGDPIYFDPDTREDAMARDTLVLREELVRLQERADDMTGLTAVTRDP